MFFWDTSDTFDCTFFYYMPELDFNPTFLLMPPAKMAKLQLVMVDGDRGGEVLFCCQQLFVARNVVMAAGK